MPKVKCEKSSKVNFGLRNRPTDKRTNGQGAQLQYMRNNIYEN